MKRGWLGDKSGQGFYKKMRGADGKDQRLVLDLDSFEYRPSAKPALPSLEMAKNAATVRERVKLLLANDPEKDKAAAISLAVSRRRCGTSLPTASAKRRTTRPPSTKRCARASTGSSAHSRCGMRPACGKPSPAWRRWEFP